VAEIGRKLFPSDWIITRFGRSLGGLSTPGLTGNNNRMWLEAEAIIILLRRRKSRLCGIATGGEAHVSQKE
jgi:hypothetical protein